MKKIALIVLVAMVAATPAMAAKKGKRAAAAPAKIDSNEASWRLVKGGFVIALPSWAIPIYLNSGQTEHKVRR
jgi:hypothetical protein